MPSPYCTATNNQFLKKSVNRRPEVKEDFFLVVRHFDKAKAVFDAHYVAILSADADSTNNSYVDRHSSLQFWTLVNLELNL